jgi:hypothetical protein
VSERGSSSACAHPSRDVRWRRRCCSLQARRRRCQRNLLQPRSARLSTPSAWQVELRKRTVGGRGTPCGGLSLRCARSMLAPTPSRMPEWTDDRAGEFHGSAAGRGTAHRNGMVRPSFVAPAAVGADRVAPRRPGPFESVARSSCRGGVLRRRGGERLWEVMTGGLPLAAVRGVSWRLPRFSACY